MWLILYLLWGFYICRRSPKPGNTALFMVLSSVAIVIVMLGAGTVVPVYAAVLGYTAAPLMFAAAIVVGLLHVRSLKAKGYARIP